MPTKEDTGSDGARVLFSNPEGIAKPASHYAQVARIALGTATLLLVSGQGPEDAAGRLVGRGNMAQQVEQVFRNIETILRASGATMGDVVKLTIFVTEMEQRGLVSEARHRYFPDQPPTSTLVEVNRLAVAEWLLEIEAIAVVQP